MSTFHPSPPRTRFSWAPELMSRALTEVQEGRLSVSEAAAHFGVPVRTLTSKVKGEVTYSATDRQKSLLSSADESLLLNYCRYCARYGFTLTQPQVMAIALALYNQRYPEASKKKLNQTWWFTFRKRHHEQLTVLAPEPDFIDQGLGTPDVFHRGRAKCAKWERIEDYFKLLQKTIDESGLRKKPQQMYSCDKTKIPLSCVRRNVQGTSNSTDHITVLACFNAAGEDVPPFIIYKGGYHEGPYNGDGLPNALYGKSETGTMDGELFLKWFVQHFLKYASKERPLLLLMDGYQFYLGLEVVQEAQREGVILLGLPPHSSHLLQPLEEHFFEPLLKHFSDFSDVSSSFLVSKIDFSEVLKHQYQRAKDQRVVVTGFRRCGLYPVDPEAIDWSRVTPPRPTRRKSSPPQLHLHSTDVQREEEPEQHRVKEEEQLQPEESSQIDIQIYWSLQSSLKQETPKTPDIKEEPEERNIEQEGKASPETDNIIISNVISVYELRQEHNYSADPPSASGRIQPVPLADRQTSSKSEPERTKTRDSSFIKKRNRVKRNFKTCTETGDDKEHVKCSICKKSYNRDYFIFVHIRNHTGERPHHCLICNEPFVLKQHLQLHMTTHTEEKPYKCPKCEQRFSQKSSLNAHAKKHDGPHSCPVCNKVFYLKHKLKTHMKVHTEERPYRCSLCGKRFKEMCLLNAHEKQHTLHPCSQCDQTFYRKTSLESHMRQHTGEEPYTCSYCHKTFIQKANRDAHLRVHTGERPFSCSQCGKTFTRKHYLKEHLERKARKKLNVTVLGNTARAVPPLPDSSRLSAALRSEKMSLLLNTESSQVHVVRYSPSVPKDASS